MLSLRVDEDIVLKVLTMNDAEALFALVDSNRLHLRRWLPWVDTNAKLEDSMLFIKSTEEQHKQSLGFQCGIWYRDQLVGIVGYHHIDWMNKNVEIGYWLGQSFQGQGIMTRSCRILVDIAFYEYQLNRVQIRCATGNTKSTAIVERLGFIKEGTTRQTEFLYDHYIDLNIYGMTADEWKTLTGYHEKKFEWSLSK